MPNERRGDAAIVSWGLLCVVVCAAQLLAACGAEPDLSDDPGGEPAACGDACRHQGTDCAGEGHMRSCQQDSDGCWRWAAAVACAPDEACRQGACQQVCRPDCSPAETRCGPGGVEVCAAASDCPTWGAAIPCPAGQLCANGLCGHPCQDECAAETSECTRDGWRSCTQIDDDGCFEWSEPQACPAGEVCAFGRCAGECADECSEGSRTCAGAGYQVCGDHDDDPCLEWSRAILCPAGQGCSNGTCSLSCSDECAPGARRCSADGQGLTECGQFDADACRDWGPLIVCEPGETCSFGACTQGCDDECAPGSARCAADGVEVCGAFDGDPCAEWSQPSPCPPGETCSGGRCSTVCEHECMGGARRCAGGSGFQVCGDHDADPCAEWGPEHACPAQTVCSQGSCDDECADECALDAWRCVLGGLQGCGDYDLDDCTEWSEPQPCAAGETCSQGRCSAQCSDECAPAAARCEQNGVQRCGEVDGDPCLEWGLSAPCPGDQVCAHGRCEAACADECAPGSARCQGEAVSACGSFDDDPCAEWGAAVLCGDGERCSGGACAPDCSDECVDGARRCVAEGVQQCVAAAVGGCARWGAHAGAGFVVGAALPCPAGQTCSAGRCEQGCVDECDRGQQRCAPGGGRQVCGDWDADVCLEFSEGAACPVGESCSDGTCAAVCHHECDAAQARCVDGQAPQRQVCGDWDADPCREWGPAQPCEPGALCRDGVCHACVPSEEVVDGADNDCDRVVDEAPEGTLPGWCVLQEPHALVAAEGFDTAPVFGRVWAAGITEAPGADPTVLAELGWGPDGSEPAQQPERWTWRPAVHFAQADNDDLYSTPLLAPPEGTYDYAYRFSVDGGSAWAYCDSDGSGESGYTVEQAGDLHVTAGVGWGNLQWPHALEVVSGQQAGPYYGRVYRAGITDAAGQGPGLLAELGWGPDGTHPEQEPERWSWVAASFHADAGFNDEYSATFAAPAPGSYDVAFRYALAGQDAWVYADIGGSHDGYTPASASALVVRAERPVVDIVWAGNWGVHFSREADCASGREAIGEPVVADAWVRDRAVCRQVLAEVYAPGHTDEDGADPGALLAEVVRRPVPDDGPAGEPEAFQLGFTRRVGNNHEYRWDLPAGDFPVPSAFRYTFVFRFSGDAGATWFTVGQGDGPAGGEPRTLSYDY